MSAHTPISESARRVIRGIREDKRQRTKRLAKLDMQAAGLKQHPLCMAIKMALLSWRYGL